MKGNKNKKKHKCPSCIKSYQSENVLDAHCLNRHGKTLKELRELKAKSTMTLGDFMNTGDEKND